MRIVAIRALHRAFVYAVFKRHGELRAHCGVAGVTKLGLLLGQQKLRGLSLVNGVAIGAHNVVLRVGAAADVGA